ncbi:MAG: hypothetical protein AB9873_13530 [Syntrophobacteraceae bacterium]
MGSLTAYLQEEFIRHCPQGWICRSEAHLLQKDFEQLLGYAPRVDVVLERQDQTMSLWIEFEISRADPVANHAKFATSHVFQPQEPTNMFIAMISPHVTFGRRNLAANTIYLMRLIGMRAFQTVLFPFLSGDEIKRLNHLSKDGIRQQFLDVRLEIERALLISDKIVNIKKCDIHFASDISDVMLNVHTWNLEITTDEAKTLWGKRVVTYFVYDSRSRNFAPSKFCAYVAISPYRLHNQRQIGKFVNTSVMTIELYTDLDQSEPRFDGGKARTHLTNNLGMKIKSIKDDHTIQQKFESWLYHHKDSIIVHPRGPYFITSPPWFA